MSRITKTKSFNIQVILWKRIHLKTLRSFISRLKSWITLFPFLLLHSFILCNPLRQGCWVRSSFVSRIGAAVSHSPLLRVTFYVSRPNVAAVVLLLFPPHVRFLAARRRKLVPLAKGRRNYPGDRKKEDTNTRRLRERFSASTLIYLTRPETAVRSRCRGRDEKNKSALNGRGSPSEFNRPNVSFFQRTAGRTSTRIRTRIDIPLPNEFRFSLFLPFATRYRFDSPRVLPGARPFALALRWARISVANKNLESASRKVRPSRRGVMLCYVYCDAPRSPIFSLFIAIPPPFKANTVRGQWRNKGTRRESDARGKRTWKKATIKNAGFMNDWKRNSIYL